MSIMRVSAVLCTLQRSSSALLQKVLSTNLNTRRYLLKKCDGNATVTMSDARMLLRNIVGTPLAYGEPRDAAATTLPLAKTQSELSARRMLDSYREVLVPLKRDKLLRSKYINFFNLVRHGRIMEDLDTMAVLIGYTHNMDPAKGSDQKSPIVIVTALVDSIDITSPSISPEYDIVLRGHTTWVGTTSMEISLSVEQDIDSVWHNIITAKFLMVARDPENKKQAIVSPLLVETEEEKSIFKSGQARKLARQQEAQVSLLKNPPSEAERLVIHELFTSTVDVKAGTFKAPIKPDHSVWMEETVLKNIIVCFPEERNLYNKIFGGFLMRQAFELAWANAYQYSKTRPMLKVVDDILFREPVEIGSLLYLSSQVVYTKSSHMQLKVHAEVINPQTGGRVTTNIFHYTFCTSDDRSVPDVMPKSYAEYMLYLDGRRHFENNHLKHHA